MGIGRSRVGENKDRQLTGERGRFNERDATRSFTLPSQFYTDPEIQTQETAQIFRRSWIYVGHVSDVANVRCFFVDNVGGQCLFVVRDAQHQVRAFFNVCQHRGHELLTGRGEVKQAIVCPYHGWTYGLDGALKFAKHTDTLEDFRLGDYGLREIPLASIGGLLFVNLDSSAKSLDREMSGLADTLLDPLPDLADFRVVHRLRYDIKANWKVVIDNFSEGYHIPVAHRRLSQVLDVEADNEGTVGERFAAYISRSLAGYEGFELEPGAPYRSWTVWPNLCMLSQPGCDNLIVLRMSPNGVDGCLERVDIYAPNDAQAEPLEAIRSLFVDHFNREDIAIVESVQRGLSSLGYDQGRYVGAADEAYYSESGLHRFHRQVIEALFND